MKPASSRQTHVWLLAASISAANLAMAETKPLPSKTDDAPMAEVVTWGTQVRASSINLDEETLAIRQADHMSDLLRSIPGVDIGGTHSVNTRINIRGLDDRDLAVYIDGALQTNYLYHHMGNLLINPDILKSAEIELGTNSVVHGGLGGSVRYETKDAADLLRAGKDFGLRVSASYNSNDQTSYSLTGYAQVSEKLDVLGYFSNIDRDNFEDGSGVETLGSDGETDNYLIKAGYQLTDNQRLEISYENYKDAGDYNQRPDMGIQATLGLSQGLLLPTEYERDTLNIGYEVTFDNTQLALTYYENELRLYRDESGGIRHPLGFLIPSTEKEGVADNYGFNALAVTTLANNSITQTLTYGLEYFDQNIDFDPNLNTGGDTERQSAKSTALFIEDRIDFGNGLALTPGVRYNDHETENKASNTDGDWDETTFALAAEYQISDGLQIHASYTELFKGPELVEPFARGGVSPYVSNPDLDPETGETIELGLRYSTAFDNGASLKAGLNIFEQTIEDYIGDVSAGGGNFMYDNLGTAVIDGFEASLNYTQGSMDLLLTYAKSDLDASDLEFDDTTESLREIGDSIGLEASYRFENIGLSLNYSATYVKSVDREASDTKKPSYDVHNIYARWTPQQLPALTLTAGVDNLFDEFYTSHASRSGFAPNGVVLEDFEPGRNVKVTVSYDF
jgi:hemoglobin/transferrin/lactoferrin receptor protein